MANRDKILETIRALRAKADDKGATEAEVMAAAEMLARLIVKHDVKPEELEEVKKEGAVEKGFRQGSTLHPVLATCWNGIGKFTETKPYQIKGEMRFIGVESDVVMAVYLSEMFVGAAKRLWREFQPTIASKGFNEQMMLRQSLYRGFGSRLSARLIELADFRAEQRKAASQAHSTALVIVKTTLIKDKMAEMGLTLRKGRKDYHGQIDGKAFIKGREAADNVNLGRPFGGAEARGELQC